MKLNRAEAKKALIRYLDRKRGPLLIGEAAVTLGHTWSLQDAEGLLSEMVEDGTLRRAREDEKRTMDVRVAYVRCRDKGESPED